MYVVIVVLIILLAVVLYRSRESFRNNYYATNYEASMVNRQANFVKDKKGNTTVDYYLAGQLYNQ